jgi:hypothetical protein
MINPIQRLYHPAPQLGRHIDILDTDTGENMCKHQDPHADNVKYECDECDIKVVTNIMNELKVYIIVIMFIAMGILLNTCVTA